MCNLELWATVCENLTFQRTWQSQPILWCAVCKHHFGVNYMTTSSHHSFCRKWVEATHKLCHISLHNKQSVSNIACRVEMALLISQSIARDEKSKCLHFSSSVMIIELLTARKTTTFSTIMITSHRTITNSMWVMIHILCHQIMWATDCESSLPS